MREKRTIQSSIFEQHAEHEIGRELKAMSVWLDTQLDLLDWVEAYVKQRNVEQIGRKELSIESVLRCAILKQYQQLSYEDLVFCLMDPAYCQTFAHLTQGLSKAGHVAKLYQCHLISLGSRSTLVYYRVHTEPRWKKGEMLRIDSIVTDSPILSRVTAPC